MIRSLAIFLTFVLCSGAGSVAAPGFSVDASVALASLVALCDNHIKTMAGTLDTLAATPAAASGDWSQIEPPLRKAASLNVAAVVFYANADGAYWTIAGGKQPSTISDRPYFMRAMRGERPIGDLIASRSTGKSVVVVAVPVTGKNGKVSGVLGASIYLDQLSVLLVDEMRLRPGMLFWALDPHGTIALHSDSSNVFTQPGTLTPALKSVTADMLAQNSGTETYSYKGQKRTVIFRKSSLTGWTFGFGIAH
jgi:methyl-accepting chemotaxis protein